MREANKVPGAPVCRIGEVLRGDGISEVIRSRNPTYPVGTLVKGFIGWEEYTRVPLGQGLQTLPEGARVQTKIPLSAYIGVLGMPGMTAHVSLLKLVGQPKAGETIYISAASGAVGMCILEDRGCRHAIASSASHRSLTSVVSMVHDRYRSIGRANCKVAWFARRRVRYVDGIHFFGALVKRSVVRGLTNVSSMFSRSRQ